MLRKNFGKSHKELWQIAERVLAECSAPFNSRNETVTNEDIKIATESGFVEWDEDGASPTNEFNFWDVRAEVNNW